MEPIVGATTTLSLYLKCNTPYIVRSWRQCELIRERYNFRLGKYIIFHVDRIADIFRISSNHPVLRNLAAKLYRTL